MIIFPLAWLQVAEYAYYIIVAALAVSSVIQAQKARKAAQQALEKARGLLYQFRSTTSPRRVLYGRRRIGGLEAYVTSAGAKHESLFYVLIWTDGPNQAVEQILFDGIQVHFDSSGRASGKWTNLVQIESRLGGTDNFTAITDMGIPGWGPSDMLLGINYSIIRMTYDDAVFQNGVPNISAVLQGRNDIFDERSSTESYSENPVLCLNHYLTQSRTGPGIDYASRVAIDEFVEAANACDEDVALSISGLQKRYTYNDIVTLDEDPELIIEGFKTAFSGVVVYTGGRWHYYAGIYVTPTFTITKKMLVGPVMLQTKIGKINHINTVKGTYVAECNNWQPTSFLPVTNATYVAEDGEELLENIDYTSKNTTMEARRMAKIELMRQRLSRSVQIQVNIEGMRAQPGLPVIFDFPELQFSNQPMLVMEYGMSIADNKITIGLNLREYGPEIFEWAPSDDDQANSCNSPYVQAPGSPPGFPDSPGGPGLHYGDLLPGVYPPDAGFAASCKVQGGTATLIGDSEFSNGTTILPSVPPKKYLKQTFSGHYRFELGYLSCVCQSFNDVVISGTREWDKMTGVLTSTAQYIQDFGNTGCVSDGGVWPRTGGIAALGDVPWGSADHQYCLIVQSRKNQIATFGQPGCTPWNCEVCHTDFFSNPFYCRTSGTNGAANLSQEDTEENAIARLNASFGPWYGVTEIPISDDSCASDWGLHTSGFSFPYTQARLVVRLSGSGGYFIGWPYEVEFDIMQRDSGSSDPFVKAGTLGVTISPDSSGGGMQEVDIPRERGKETRVANGRLV